MIEVNERQVYFTKFPDGTSSLRLPDDETSPLRLELTEDNNCLIRWKYGGDEECMMLWYLVNHVREHNPDIKIVLDLPYLPNARMDRIKNTDEVFTLKWFAKFINSMEFSRVYIRDPHSSVGAALIDRVMCFGIANVVKKVVSLIPSDRGLIYCYPDEGATKKYSEQIKEEYVYGIKHRDWRTGEIKGLQLNNADIVKDKDVLIVDDICSRGGTFIYTAKALKEAGAKDIYLYVTHCENTIFDGDVPYTDLISHVYTTDSIFRGQHEKIAVISEV